jgi:hypothetical protein
MSTLSTIKCSYEVVQKDMCVKTCAFLLNGHDILYSLSANNVVLMVLILAQKSTNIQFPEFHKPVGQKTVPAFLFGDSMTSASQLTSFLG